MTADNSPKMPRYLFSSEPNRGIWKHWKRSVPSGCASFYLLLVTNLEPFAASRLMALRASGCETVRVDSALAARLAMQSHFDVVVLGHELKPIEKRTLASAARRRMAKVIWLYTTPEEGTDDADILLAINGEPENLVRAVCELVAAASSREVRRRTAL